MKTPKIIRPTKLTMNLPEDLRAKLDLYLYSEVEQRIPFGAYQQFIGTRIREFFSERRTYLSESEVQVARRVLAEVIGNGEEEWPQESWLKHFANPEEAYLTAKSLVEKLK